MRLLLITIFTFLFIQLNSQSNHWVQTFGSINQDWAYDLKVDHTDNIIVIGSVGDSSQIVFSDTTLNYDLSNGFGFVCKQDSLNNLIWFKQIGVAKNRILIRNIEIDLLNNIYIAGSFVDSLDFDPGGPTDNILVSNGAYGGAFLAKYRSNGNLIWVKAFNGNGAKEITSIYLEDSSNIYISGNFYGQVDFDPGPSSNLIDSYGSSDGFISKFDTDGNFKLCYRIGGITRDRIQKVLINRSHDLVAVGSFTGSVRMNPRSSNQQLFSGIGRDVFILRLDTAGNYISSKQIGGTGNVDVAKALIDNDTLYLIGNLGDSRSSGSIDFSPNSPITNYSSTGNEDSYLVKYDPSDSLIWLNRFGGKSLQRILDFYITSNSKIYCSVVLADSSYTFKNRVVADTIIPSIGSSCLIAELDRYGNYQSLINLNSQLDVGVYAIDFDSRNNLYTAGLFQGQTDFNPTNSTNYKTSIGSWDCFIMKNFGSLITSNIENKEIESSGFKIYPNPTNGLFEIELENKSNAIVIIRDMSGRLISQQTIPQKTNKIQLELNDVSGIYFVQIILEDGKSFSSKLIKL